MAGIEYHPFICLQSNLRDAPCVQQGSVPIEDFGKAISERLTRATLTYRLELDWNRRAYLKANGRAPDEDDLPKHLYHPLSWRIAFGHTDSVELVLLEDFDPYLRITGEVGLPVERCILSFCPKLSSLGLSGLKAADDAECPFPEIDELFRGPLPLSEAQIREAFAKRAQTGAVVLPKLEPSVRDFQRKLPLLVVAQIRVGGIASLGHGLLFQRAVFQAIGRTIISVQRRLLEACDAAPAKDSLSVLELDRETILSLKCAFLDPQDSNDITLLIACRNYSLAAAILVVLRTLTFDDVMREGELKLPDLPHEQAMQEVEGVILEAHNALPVCGEHPERRCESRSIAGLGANHVFASTYSIPAVLHEAFLDPAAYKCRGKLEMYPRLNLNPGHLKNVERRLSEAFDTANAKRPEFRPVEVPILKPAGNFHRFLLGRYDYEYALANHAAHKSYGALPVAAAFAYLREIVASRNAEAGPACLGGETGVTGSATWMVVPFPSLEGSPSWPLLRDVDYARHRPLMAILEEVCRHAFPAARAEGRNEAREANEEISSQRIQAALRRLGAPAQLGRTMTYLCQNFESCLKNTLLFDSVLDLYDAFSTFQDLLEELARAYPDADGEGLLGGSSRPSLDPKVLQRLGEFVEGLQDAMAHRINVHRDPEMADRAVDFRGGLNRLVSAVDVPLKCSVGLHKWTWQKVLGEDERKLRIAAVTQFAYTAESSCLQTIVGPPEEPDFLLRMDMNVAHLFNPGDFTLYIHEAAHAILELLKLQLPQLRALLPRSPETSLMADRFHEVFAESLTHLFVFGSDCELFERYYAARFSQSRGGAAPASKPRAPATSPLTRFFEILYRGFLVVEPVAFLRRESGTCAARWPLDSHPWSSGAFLIDPITRAFLAYVNRVSPFLAQFHKLWTGKHAQAARKYFADHLRRILEDCRPPALRIWWHALNIYKTYAGEVDPWRGADAGKKLQETIERAFEEGESSVYDQFFAGDPGAAGSPPGGARTPDSEKYRELVLLCELLYCYIRFSYACLDPKQGIHLIRDGNGFVTYPVYSGPGIRGWNEFQLDPRYADQFTCDTTARRRRLLRKIVILKALWDISTRQRARRLVRIIRGCGVLDTEKVQ